MRISTHEQLLELLDEVVARSGRGDRTSRSAAPFWTELLSRPGHPLVTDLPDENLADWHDRGLLGTLRGARVLDVGCGAGRNTRWFARQGAHVDGVDIAAGLLDQAHRSMPPGARLIACDILRDDLPGSQYDLVYDSGCFHHIAPHRRETYRRRILDSLAPGGRLGIVTFSADHVESAEDVDIVASGDVGGGIGYSEADLLEIFAPLKPVECRAVRTGLDGVFGAPFLLAGLFHDPSSAPS